MKSGGNVENSKIVEGNNKKIDFENIKFRKIVKKTNKKKKKKKKKIKKIKN